MRINLSQNEIEQALIEYVENLGVPLSGKTVTARVIAGRGPGGHKAVVEFVKKVPSENSAADTTEVFEEEETPTEETPAIPFNFNDNPETETD